MAALPWLVDLKSNQYGSDLTDYLQTVANHTPDVFQKLCGEQFTQIEGIEPTQHECIQVGKKTYHWSDLDGNLFNQTALQNAGDTPLSQKDYNQGDPDADARRAILRQLRQLPRRLPVKRTVRY